MSFIEAVYEIRAPTPAEARRVALAVAREQTLEAVPGLAPAALEEALLGRVESLERKAAGVYAATLQYAEALVGPGIGQLVNLLFGNVSLFTGVRLVDVHWPRTLLDRFPGPAFGLEGLRLETGVRGRALLCAILKPVGLTPRALARQARALALAGIDVIKDDHNLADQASAPFAERVRSVQEAVAAANARTGRRCLYLPHLSGGGSVLQGRVALLHESGIRGTLIAPMLLGWETTAALAAESGLLLLAHPTTSGVFFGRQHGVTREVFFGELLRLAGADGVIFPNAAGRFPVPVDSCREVATRLRAPRGDLRPSFPAPGGGMDVERVARWRKVYGDDTLFLLGSALLKEYDLGRAVAALLEAVEA